MYRRFPVAIVLLLVLLPPPCVADPATKERDRFAITQLHPTAPSGHEWFSTWINSNPRSIGDAIRLYVHDPKCEFQWGENLEITVYLTRVSETKDVGYNGLQIFARTN